MTAERGGCGLGIVPVPFPRLFAVQQESGSHA